MTPWLEKHPLRALAYAVAGAVALALLQLLAEAAIKGIGFNATKLLTDHGLGEGWGARSAIFLLAFPLGAGVLGTGSSPKHLARLFVLAIGVAFACASVGGMRSGLVDPLVMLLGAATALASAIEGRQRYLYALGLGVVVVLAVDAGSIGGSLTLKTVGAWLVIALFAYGPAVVLATFLAVGDSLQVSVKTTAGSSR